MNCNIRDRIHEFATRRFEWFKRVLPQGGLLNGTRLGKKQHSELTQAFSKARNTNVLLQVARELNVLVTWDHLAIIKTFTPLRLPEIYVINYSLLGRSS